jgi:hypothetical protein
MKSKRRVAVAVLGAIVGIAGLLVYSVPKQGSAQEAPAVDGAPQGEIVRLDRAVVRTPEEAAAAEATRPDPNPSRVETIPFRPTMDVAAYAAQKAASATGVPTGDSLPAGVPPAIVTSFTGLTKSVSGGLFPPDTDGAIGTLQYCQAVNSRFRCFNRGTLAIVRDQSLAAFFGYFAQTLFDPRVIYDTTYGRWIVMAEAFQESAAVQRQFVATSLGTDAAGGFRILNINVRGLSGVGGTFWDYPMGGIDEDSIMLSANLFSLATNAYVGSRLLFLNKARLYLGLGGAVGCIFSGGVFNLGTIGVPIVLDLNNETFTAQTPNGSGNAILTGFRATDRICPVVTRLSTFGVGAYAVPANAAQLGSGLTIDTLDNRFNSVLTQVGSNTWGVHTVGPGLASARWRRLSIGGVLGQLATGLVPKVGATSAYNPSIAANAANTIFLTWTESSSALRPAVRVGRKTLAAPAVEGTTAIVSAVPNTGDFQASRGEVRWGDYSSTRVDPLDATRAWSVNEFALLQGASGAWASRIVRFGP